MKSNTYVFLVFATLVTLSPPPVGVLFAEQELAPLAHHRRRVFHSGRRKQIEAKPRRIRETDGPRAEPRPVGALLTLHIPQPPGNDLFQLGCAMLGKVRAKINQPLQSTRRAFDVAIVHHDGAKHLRRVHELEPITAALVFIRGPAARRVLKADQNVDGVVQTLFGDGLHPPQKKKEEKEEEKERNKSRNDFKLETIGSAQSKSTNMTST